MTLPLDRAAMGLTLASVCLLSLNGAVQTQEPGAAAATAALGVTPTVTATVAPTAVTENLTQTEPTSIETVEQMASNRVIGAPVPTLLTINPAGRLVVGDRPKVLARLTTKAGEAVPDAPVQLYLDGLSERRTRTDDEGVAAFPLQRDRRAGTYVFEFEFGGLPGFLASKVSTELVIHPAHLEVHTVPSLSGMQFSLDGRSFFSDEDGIARIEVDRVGSYRLEILSLEAEESDFRARFRRWGDVFTPSREVNIPRAGPLQVGFDVSYRVSQEFVDLAEQPIDPAREISFTLKSSDGAVYTFDNVGPHWLKAGRVVRRTFGLEEAKLQYSVDSVVIGGSNVVNRAQQRFYLQPNDRWQIQLLLYSARITGRDALFGFPIGRAILLQHPDGRWERHALSPGAELTLESLPRGQYRATVESAWGLSPVVPLALSRNQEVRLLVVSYLDIATSMLVMTSVALGLLFVGRPHLLRDLRARVPVTRWDWRLDWPGDLRTRLARGLRESLARPIQTLRHAGIVTVGQILERLENGDEELLTIRGFGRKSLEELKRALNRRRFVRKRGSGRSRSSRGP